jgi:mono/diheme cytochrome c family protein
VKKTGKVLLVGGLLLLVILAIAITLSIGWRPFIGPKARPLTSQKFEATPQRLERGRYIFNAMSACVDCHSEHDMKAPDHPVQAGMEGAGEIMPFDDLPGRIVASNLTSDVATGAGSWSDDQIARAIREGIGHDGRALFPMMPYEHYRSMSDEDLASVVVYIRSLPPVKHELPKTEVIFPVKYLIRGVPQPVKAPVNAPDPKDRVAWGAYMVSMGGCVDCHTPMQRGEPIKGMEFAGGQKFTGGWGSSVVSANITPDASGISYYDDDLFVKALRTGYVGARKLDPLMPAAQYSGQTDDDLKAIFAYLKTVKPVHHRVDNTEPPTYCKLCRGTHGAGDKN